MDALRPAIGAAFAIAGLLLIAFNQRLARQQTNRLPTWPAWMAPWRRAVERRIDLYKFSRFMTVVVGTAWVILGSLLAVGALTK